MKKGKFKVVFHTMDGVTKSHIAGAGFVDFQTLCGSCWDYGTFKEGTSDTVECIGCLSQAQEVLRVGNLRGLRELIKESING